MSRSLTVGMLAEIQKNRLKPAVFVDCQFSSGHIYVWSGIGSVSWNGQTWVGLGKLGGISSLPETTEVRADGVQLSLSGIPSDLINSVLTEIRQGKACNIYFGCLDDNGAVIADPFKSFSGRTDTASIDEGGDTSTVVINVENSLIDISRPHERRYTHDDQQIDYPGDLGFEFVPSLQEKNVVWGKGASIARTTGFAGKGGSDPYGDGGGNGGPNIA